MSLPGGSSGAATGPSSLLLGAASLDIYLGRDLVLPGGGVLNMAWHLRDEPDPWHLLTRVGDDHPDVFLEFLTRHRIAHSPGSIVGRGSSASIDIVIQPDLQPFMDNFVEGVWATYRSTPEEEAAGRGRPATPPGARRGRDPGAGTTARGGSHGGSGGHGGLPRVPPLHRGAVRADDARGRHRLRGLAGRARRPGRGGAPGRGARPGSARRRDAGLARRAGVRRAAGRRGSISCRSCRWRSSARPSAAATRSWPRSSRRGGAPRTCSRRSRPARRPARRSRRGGGPCRTMRTGREAVEALRAADAAAQAREPPRSVRRGLRPASGPGVTHGGVARRLPGAGPLMSTDRLHLLGPVAASTPGRVTHPRAAPGEPVAQRIRNPTMLPPRCLHRRPPRP